MAINYWKLAGKPLAYSPLPLGVNKVTIPLFKSYTITFKAKTSTNARLVVSSFNNVGDMHNIIPLTSDFTTYSFSWYESEAGEVLFIDTDNKGDIEIKDIELVQKPLPKLTLNGIDPFGAKWQLAPQAKVIDESTLELNATATNQYSGVNVAVPQNTVVTLSVEHSGEMGVYGNDTASWLVPVTSTQKTVTFNTGNNKGLFINLRNLTNTTGKFTFTKPMLNLGAIPAPYSKKTGDKMVLPVWNKGKNLIPFDKFLMWDPTYRYIKVTLSAGEQYSLSSSKSLNTIVRRVRDSSDIITDAALPKTFTAPTSEDYYVFVRNPGQFWSSFYSDIPAEVQLQLEKGTTPTKYEPYAVQLNPKPKKFVPKKNLFNKNAVTNGFYVSSFNGSLVANEPSCSSDFTPVKPLSNYKFSGVGDVFNTPYAWYDINKTFISGGVDVRNDVVAPSNAFYIRFTVFKTSVDTQQLEPGSTQTPYEPYQLITPRAKTGLSFNGVTDYLQLPSMTMDSIEIECLIDGVQPLSNPFLFDARGGLTNGYFSKLGGLGGGWSSLLVDGVQKPNKLFSDIPNGQRTKFKAISTIPFTDDVTILNNVGFNGNAKGTIYKVTPYLNGVPVVTYDFENPSNIVGSTVIPNAKNLIPSFEDAKWSLHANAQPLGKDVLRLNATSTFNQNLIPISLLPNTQYLAVLNQNSGLGFVISDKSNINTNVQIGYTTSGKAIFTTGSNTNNLALYLTNGSIGSFDFIQPKLIQLDGKEGTLVGKPTQLNKASKRSLYAKR